MIPVTQTKVVVRNSKDEIIVNGNCYAAVIASLLELPIEQVPNVEVFFKYSQTFCSEVMHTFLNLIGWELYSNDDFKVYHNGSYGVADGTRFEKMQKCSNKYYLVSGPSIRGVNHICIYRNGILVHDPHPTKEGLVELLYFEELCQSELPTPPADKINKEGEV